MKHQRLSIIFLMIVLGEMAYGQGPLGPGSKKARTPDDYTVRTLTEAAALLSEAETTRGDIFVVTGDILPSRVKVTYSGRARPLPQNKKQLLHRWAQRYAGAPEHYTVPYETELLFGDQKIKYWLAVKKQSIPVFRKELRKGDSVDLFLIRLGAVRSGDHWEPLLLVESFQKPK